MSVYREHLHLQIQKLVRNLHAIVSVYIGNIVTSGLKVQVVHFSYHSVLQVWNTTPTAQGGLRIFCDIHLDQSSL